MSLKDALIASKLAGGGGGSALPTPSASNVGSGVVVEKKTVAGAAIVPEQTVTTEYEDPENPEYGSIVYFTGTLPSIEEYQTCIFTVNGTDYNAVYFDYSYDVDIDETTVYSLWQDGDDVIAFQTVNEAGTYTFKVSGISYEYEYALDPYAAYDVVIRLNDDSLIGSTSGTVEKGDITAVEAKGLAGVPITAFVYGVNGDPDFPYTRTFSIVSCYWDNYDSAHDDHHLDMVIAECEPWNVRVNYRRLLLYTTGNLSLTEFKRKVDLEAL